MKPAAVSTSGEVGAATWSSQSTSRVDVSVGQPLGQQAHLRAGDRSRRRRGRRRGPPPADAWSTRTCLISHAHDPDLARRHPSGAVPRASPRRSQSMRRRIAAAALAVAAAVPTVLVGTPADSAVRIGPRHPLRDVPGRQLLARRRRRRLKVHPRSAAWKSHMSPTRRLHPDFGPSGRRALRHPDHGRGRHPRQGAGDLQYADESDRGPLPARRGQQDRGRPAVHRRPARDHGRRRDLPPLRDVRDPQGRGRGGTPGRARPGTWAATPLRPRGWTSADAAGLPILPGLLRYDEVRAGHVDHAIRFTTNVTDRRFIWPARHQAGSVSRPQLPADGRAVPAQGELPDQQLPRGHPRGAAGDEDGTAWCWPTTARRGTSRATQDTRWPTGLLDQLKSIPASRVRGGRHRAADGQPRQRPRPSALARLGGQQSRGDVVDDPRRLLDGLDVR